MARAEGLTERAGEERRAQDLSLELRRVLSNAYAFLQGERAAESFGALTYEALADQQIERIEGRQSLGRPNELERIERLERELVSLVAQLRTLPAEAFVSSDPARDVNTPPGSERDAGE
jgi:hypothetical protein